MAVSQDLKAYWRRLEEERPGEVLRVPGPVRADFVPTAIALLAEALPSSPALFIEKVDGFDHPVLFTRISHMDHKFCRTECRFLV